MRHCSSLSDILNILLTHLSIFYLFVPPEYKFYNFRELVLFWTLPPGLWASLVAQMVKYPPAMQETWVPPLGREDLLEKRMTTQSSALACRLPGTEEPGGLRPPGLQ